MRKAAAVPKGYKQTEVGVIPSDWNLCRIGNFCKLINGRGFKPFEWSERGLPIIRIQNLNGSDDFNYFAGSYDKKLEVNSGDLLFAWSGSRGTSFGPHIWNGPFGLLNYHTWKIQIHNADSKNFLFHALKNLTSYIEGWAHGASALVHVQKWQMEGFELALPPTKAEQEAIAEALSDADALIESLEQLIAKKRLIKKGAMQELLTGKRRLPGFEVKRGYKQTEVGIIPEDWDLKKVNDLAVSVSSGKSRVDSQFGDFPVYGSTGIIGRCTKGNYLGAAILVARVGANAGKLSLVDGEYGVTDNTIILRVDEKCHLEYFGRQLDAKKLNSMVFGSGQPLITGTQIKKIAVAFPPTKAEQETIATILSDMDAEIASLEAKLNKARQIKQGMMQELLTGRIRLV